MKKIRLRWHFLLPQVSIVCEPWIRVFGLSEKRIVLGILFVIHYISRKFVSFIGFKTWITSDSFSIKRLGLSIAYVSAIFDSLILRLSKRIFNAVISLFKASIDVFSNDWDGASGLLIIIGMLHSWVHNLGRGGATVFGLCLAWIFLISISVVFTQPGWNRNYTQNIEKKKFCIGGVKCNLRRYLKLCILTIGLCTSQNALSWLSNIFLSVFSRFLSTLLWASACMYMNSHLRANIFWSLA